MLIDQPQFCDHIFSLPDVLSYSPLGSGMQPLAYQPVELIACRPGEAGLAAKHASNIALLHKIREYLPFHIATQQNHV